MHGSCECFYLIDRLYGSVGGYQGVARVSLCGCVWLPGCLYLICIWEVARELLCSCQDLAMSLLWDYGWLPGCLCGC